MRTNTDITIQRFSSDNWAAIPYDLITVPITAASRRKFHLMTEDSITLVFSLTQPYEFKIGDYVNDQLFGLFIIRERQLPNYNKATGGYDYNLRFDRAYWLWENHILMLTAPLGTADITPSQESGNTILAFNGNDTFKRQESVWCITAALEEHVKQVLANLVGAGLRYYNRYYKARIHTTATKAKEIRYINYDSKHIITALSELANAFECEWWVTYETENGSEYGYINFGKCELGNTAEEFVLGDNVETMTASRDLTDYANRIYAFGGTKNVPLSYRKKLLLHIDSQKTIGGVACCMDSTRKVDPYTMLQDDGTQVEQISFQLAGLYHANARVNPSTTPVAPPTDNEIVHDKGVTKPNHSIISYRSVAHKVGDSSINTFGFKKDMELAYSSFNAGLRFSHNANVLANMRIELRLFLEEFDTYTDGAEPTRKIYLTGNGTANPYVVVQSFAELASISDVGYVEYNFVGDGKVKLTGGKTYKLVLEGKAEFDVEVGGWIQAQDRDFIGVSDMADKCLMQMPSGKSFEARVVYDNNTYNIIFNPSGCIEGEEDSFYFSLDASQWQQLTWDTKHVYSGTSVTLTYSTSSNYDCMKVPCQEGDVFKITGHGAASYRLYSWLNSQERVILIAGANQNRTDYEITAPANAAYLVVNAHRNYTRSVYAQSSPEVVELLDYRADMVESAWYTDDTDDPSSLIGLGDRRLRLPSSTNGYVETPNTLEVQRVEMTIKADNIYPKCYLRVTSVRTEQRTEKIVYADDTEYSWPWIAYTVQAELIDGIEFPFRKTFVKDGEKLRALFLSDYDEQNAYEEMGIGSEWQSHDGYLLAGMEFDVGFSPYGNEYTLIRNENYGAKLPSSMLFPKVGDTFVLTGWTVDSMSELGLVSSAETQLLEFTQNYLSALQDDGWTFRCNMMTDKDEPLLAEGTKVKVLHDSLPIGYKQSRIIGYELKLDIPEDSPVYEVGETDAYSRIKQLEKQVEKL